MHDKADLAIMSLEQQDVWLKGQMGAHIEDHLIFWAMGGCTGCLRGGCEGAGGGEKGPHSDGDGTF